MLLSFLDEPAYKEVAGNDVFFILALTPYQPQVTFLLV
jgi:hypothetical protein